MEEIGLLLGLLSVGFWLRLGSRWADWTIVGVREWLEDLLNWLASRKKKP